jgi:hypothetical protein
MGSFYFHVRKGKKLIPDEEGGDLADVHAGFMKRSWPRVNCWLRRFMPAKTRSPTPSWIADEAGDPFAHFRFSPFCRSGLGCKLLPPGILKAGMRAHATTCRIP